MPAPAPYRPTTGHDNGKHQAVGRGHRSPLNTETAPKHCQLPGLPEPAIPLPPTGHDNGEIRLWDVDTGRHQTLKQHTNTVSCLTMALFRRSEELLISAGFDGLVGVRGCGGKSLLLGWGVGGDT